MDKFYTIFSTSADIRQIAEDKEDKGDKGEIYWNFTKSPSPQVPHSASLTHKASTDDTINR
jgi:hypothetical protein